MNWNTKVPHVFNPLGTLAYAACSCASFVFMIISPWWTPPWPVLLSMYFYVFMSTGLIAFGRIEGNKDAQLFIEAIQNQSEINKRSMN